MSEDTTWLFEQNKPFAIPPEATLQQVQDQNETKRNC